MTTRTSQLTVHISGAFVHSCVFRLVAYSYACMRVPGRAIRVRTYVRTRVRRQILGKEINPDPRFPRVRGFPEWFPRGRSVRGAAEGAAVSQVMQVQEFREPPPDSLRFVSIAGCDSSGWRNMASNHRSVCSYCEIPAMGPSNHTCDKCLEAPYSHTWCGPTVVGAANARAVRCKKCLRRVVA